MCKELPVILFNTVVDPKRIIGGGEEQVVADPPPQKKGVLFPPGQVCRGPSEPEGQVSIPARPS
jgi:hypothetical protein